MTGEDVMRTARRDYSEYCPPTTSSTAVRSPSDVVVDINGPVSTLPPADVGTIPPATRSSIRVLIVDDDRSLREGCASVLQVEGYNVSSCGRGDEALDLVRSARYDVILVDLYMTPVAGMEILKAALATEATTIVVVMTGNPRRHRLTVWLSHRQPDTDGFKRDAI